METQLLEARVIAIAEAVLAGRQVEDDRVELKAVWPDAKHKTARQIAGHANASGGEPILWIVGLDEKSRKYGSTAGTEPANWWGAVSSHFVEVTPDLNVLRVPVAVGHDVFALQFATDRAPYVISVVGGGQVEREVPWREGNSTRTARRHEMIRSVVAEAAVPKLELIGGLVELDEFIHDPRTGEYGGVAIGDLRMRCALDMFVSAAGLAYFPEHRQSLMLEAGTVKVELAPFNFTGSYRFEGASVSGGLRRVPFGNVTVLGASGLEVKGPGELKLRGELVLGTEEATVLRRAAAVSVDLCLPVDGSERSARLASDISWVQVGDGDIPAHNDSWQTCMRFRVGAWTSWWI